MISLEQAKQLVNMLEERAEWRDAAEVPVSSIPQDVGSGVDLQQNQVRAAEVPESCTPQELLQSGGFGNFVGNHSETGEE